MAMSTNLTLWLMQFGSFPYHKSKSGVQVFAYGKT